MQKIILIGLVLIFSKKVCAQQSRFVYIQTENKQPFYVKVNNKLYSSTSSGYTIIPKLQDGNYTFSIGFPKSEWKEQHISYSINNSDAGFLLKNFGDKGWGLFNLQTLDVLMAGNAKPIEIETISKENLTDNFAIMLADVVADPTIKQTTKSIVETNSKPEVKESKVVEPVIQTVFETKKAEQSTEFVQIVKLSEKINNDGIQIMYLDKINDSYDTISVTIQDTIQNIQVIESIEKVQEVVKPFEVIIEEPQQETIKQEDASTKFLEIELANPNNTNQNGLDSTTVDLSKEVTEKTQTENKQVTIDDNNINSTNCKSIASNEDFLKLRKKMASQQSDVNMVIVAKKTFKSKCFTTDQLKNLCFLFLDDEGKFQFFESAFPHVSDKVQFTSLETQLTQEYYIKRFKEIFVQK